MNVYVYPQEIVSIDGDPRVTMEPPRILVELREGSIDMVLTPEWAATLVAEVYKAFPHLRPGGACENNREPKPNEL